MHRMPVFHKLLSTMMTSEIKNRASSRSFPVGEDHTLTFFFFFPFFLHQRLVKGDEGPGLLDRMIACEEYYFSLTCWRNGQQQAKTPNDFLQYPPKKNHSLCSDLHCRLTQKESKTFFRFRSTLPNHMRRIKNILHFSKLQEQGMKESAVANKTGQKRREEKRKRASYLLLDYSQDTIDKPLHPSPTPDHHYTRNESSKLSPLPKNKTNPINHQNTQLQLLLLFSPNTLTPLPPTSAPTRTPTHHHHHHSQISTSSPPHSNFFESFSQRRQQQQEI